MYILLQNSDKLLLESSDKLLQEANQIVMAWLRDSIGGDLELK